MKILKFIVLILMILEIFSSTPSSQIPAAHDMKQIFCEESDRLKINGLEEIERDFFRQNVYIVSYKSPIEKLEKDKMKVLIKEKLENNNWSYQREYKSIHETNPNDFTMRFKKKTICAMLNLLVAILSLDFGVDSIMNKEQEQASKRAEYDLCSMVLVSLWLKV